MKKRTLVPARQTLYPIGWHQAGPYREDWVYSQAVDDHGGLSEYEILQRQGR